VKAVSIKLSQGAKPGIGGVLPAAKVSEEIARYRGVPAHEKCVSPAAHTAFHTPRELVRFLARLRDLAAAKLHQTLCRIPRRCVGDLQGNHSAAKFDKRVPLDGR
jgi:glutamate synthase domain-containing protein 2